MTVSDYFSKWPEATALPDKSAIGIAEFLYKCFTRHGCCRVKITDQGREFVNKVIKKTCMLTLHSVLATVCAYVLKDKEFSPQMSHIYSFP